MCRSFLLLDRKMQQRGERIADAECSIAVKRSDTDALS